jgi:hypothetical protein
LAGRKEGRKEGRKSDIQPFNSKKMSLRGN